MAKKQTDVRKDQHLSFLKPPVSPRAIGSKRGQEEWPIISSLTLTR